MRHLNAVFSSLLLMTSMALPAQTGREKEPDCDEKSMKRTEIADADATIMEFAIGRTSLKDVQAKLGKAAVTRVSRNEESDESICYVSPADGTVVIFYTGAMGGWEEVTWFASWSREAGFAGVSQCTPSTVVSRNVATPSGLRLGMTREEFERIAGHPTTIARGSDKYDYLCRAKLTGEEIDALKKTNTWNETSDPYYDRMS